MRILLSGGGTGGHITPIRSVAHDIKRLAPATEITYVGERNGRFAHVLEGNPDIDHTRRIFSGKYRRYHSESLLQKLTDVRTLALNTRDILFVALGIVQALYLLAVHRPQAVFLKGGYVGVPIGLAASLYRIPIVTHDSDAIAGLANRLVSRWVTVHATAMPIETYDYPPEKTRQTGVIVSDEYQKVDADAQASFRHELAIDTTAKVLFITGGSSGAVEINRAVAAVVRDIVALDPRVYVIHQVGKGNQGIYSHQGSDIERLEIHEFLDGLYKYSGAADVIVTRAGANTLAEFAVQAKPCIVIPSPHLAGGHQIKNADYVRTHNAAVVIDEAEMVSDSSVLLRAVSDVLLSDKKQKKLANGIHRLAQTDASRSIALLMLDVAQGDTPSAS